MTIGMAAARLELTVDDVEHPIDRRLRSCALVRTAEFAPELLDPRGLAAGVIADSTAS